MDKIPYRGARAAAVPPAAVPWRPSARAAVWCLVHIDAIRAPSELHQGSIRALQIRLRLNKIE